MVFKSIIGAVCACLAVVSYNANSALVGRLADSNGDFQAYYDTEADLTWLAQASQPNINTWAEANTWASNLNINGVVDWRLPKEPDQDTYNANCSTTRCTVPEFESIFLALGGIQNTSLFDTHNSNYDLFAPISSQYWTGNLFFNFAYVFSMYTGDFNLEWKGVSESYVSAWAVHDGDVSAVPIPAAVWLFGSGLIGLIGLARRKARN